MVELKDADLSKYTTVRIGGTARRLLIPENTDELLETINTLKPEYFISGGSNLLINDRVFDLVVCLKSFDESITDLSDGMYRVGASVKLQKLIRTINDDGYGGIEYLCNVPGLVGGAVAMNAGTGRKQNRSISDHIVSIDAIIDGKPVTMKKEDCGFSHRNSFFREHPECIIISVLFRFREMTREESDRAKEEKMRYYREKQDPSHPNFGSVFRQSSYRIMLVARKLKLGKRVHFSGKTVNWMINEDHGSYSDAIKAIKKVEMMHRLLGRKIKREVITWE